MRFLKSTEITAYINAGKTVEILGNCGDLIDDKWPTITIYNLFKNNDEYVVGQIHCYLPDEPLEYYDYAYFDLVDPDCIMKDVFASKDPEDAIKFVLNEKDVEEDTFLIFPKLNDHLTEKFG